MVWHSFSLLCCTPEFRFISAFFRIHVDFCIRHRRVETGAAVSLGFGLRDFASFLAQGIFGLVSFLKSVNSENFLPNVLADSALNGEWRVICGSCGFAIQIFFETVPRYQNISLFSRKSCDIGVMQFL